MNNWPQTIASADELRGVFEAIDTGFRPLLSTAEYLALEKRLPSIAPKEAKALIVEMRQRMTI